MTVIDASILGIVEGLTEFLPVSSTAHLILVTKILGLNSTAFIKTFEIAIQTGAILAVIVLYWRRFLQIEVLKKVIIAFLPTAIIGLIFYKIVKNYLLDNIYVVLWSLALGGLFLIIFEWWRKDEGGSKLEGDKDISYKQALGIGTIQALAIIPGVSRSAATIVGGRLLGVGKTQIVTFSFLLAVPTILAATTLDVYKNFHLFAGSNIANLLIGFVSAFVMALISIRFLLSYIKKRSFTQFGVYRIVVVIIFMIFFF